MSTSPALGVASPVPALGRRSRLSAVQAEPLVAAEIPEFPVIPPITAEPHEGGSALRGLFFGALLALPLWGLVIWGIVALVTR